MAVVLHPQPQLLETTPTVTIVVPRTTVIVTVPARADGAGHQTRPGPVLMPTVDVPHTEHLLLYHLQLKLFQI